MLRTYSGRDSAEVRCILAERLDPVVLLGSSGSYRSAPAVQLQSQRTMLPISRSNPVSCAITELIITSILFLELQESRSVISIYGHAPMRRSSWIGNKQASGQKEQRRHEEMILLASLSSLQDPLQNPEHGIILPSRLFADLIVWVSGWTTLVRNAARGKNWCVYLRSMGICPRSAYERVGSLIRALF
jgi:hypothetical protein